MSVSHKHVLHVCSKDRYTGSPSDFKVHFKNMDQRVSAISPLSIIIPHQFFNITPNNNTLVIGTGVSFATKTTWTLSPGFYSTTAWIDALTAFFNTIGSDQLTSTPPVTLSDKFTSDITHYGEFHLDVGEIGFYPQESTMSNFIGLDTTQSLVNSVGGVLVLDRPVQMHGPKSILVHVSIATNHGFTSTNEGGRMSVVDYIPISDYNFGDVIRVDREGGDLHIIDFITGSDPINDLRIWLTDENGVPVTLHENVQTNFSFIIYTY